MVCTQIGEYRTRDGLQRVWKLYDKEDTGVIRFEQLKEISRSIGEYMDDQALLDMMHGVFINQSTQSNEEFTFDEFYQVISNFYSKQGWKMSLISYDNAYPLNKNLIYRKRFVPKLSKLLNCQNSIKRNPWIFNIRTRSRSRDILLMKEVGKAFFWRI